MASKINYVFLRHGYGCHNAVPRLLQKNVIPRNDNLQQVDPELSQLGVDATIRNGCAISKILTKLDKLTKKDYFQIRKMNIVGCSPLIRSMETAYFMTRRWKTPPNKIYVFPLLREIDERSDDIYSPESRHVIDIVPSYAMKSIEEQKQYLSSRGILHYFDFSFVERQPDLRKEPGSIEKFTLWFQNIFLKHLQWQPSLNVMVITHAGVLSRYKEKGFTNNSGFVLHTLGYNDSIQYLDSVSLNKYLPRDFFTDYSKNKYNNLEYFCPSDRCAQICTATSQIVQPIKFLDNKCNINANENL